MKADAGLHDFLMDLSMRTRQATGLLSYNRGLLDLIILSKRSTSCEIPQISHKLGVVRATASLSRSKAPIPSKSDDPILCVIELGGAGQVGCGI